MVQLIWHSLVNVNLVISRMSFRLYKDQQAVAREAVEILTTSDWVYLALECQIGKTHISLATCDLIGSKSVLVVTLKNVVTGRGFEDDYDMQGNTFDLATINYESAHKFLDHEFDTLIIDEAHSLGAFPKLSKRGDVLTQLKKKADKVIFLSATPTPESYSQWFHQIFGLDSPLSEFKNFYKFKDRWVIPKEVKVSASRTVIDYSECKEGLNEILEPFIISMTYDYAMFSRWVHGELDDDVANLRYGGQFSFTSLGKRFHLNENESYKFTGKHILPCDGGVELKESTVEDCIIKIDTSKEIVKGDFTIIKKIKKGDIETIEEIKVEELRLAEFETILKRDKCIYIGENLVSVESGSSLLSKASQLSSGVLIDDEKQTHVLSDIKIREALPHFGEKRLAIFYFFIGEKKLIQESLGSDVTDDLSKFKSGEAKHFVTHFRSGKAGIRLSQADELVMFNVPYSYEQFYQSRQRRSSLLSKGEELKVWWIFTTHGIEKKIFDVVQAKKDFTLQHYKKL